MQPFIDASGVAKGHQNISAAQQPAGDSRTDGALPVYDLGPCLEGDVEARRRLAKGIAESLRRTGCCVVRDPRVGPQDNCQFLDTMEAYFAQPAAAKMADARPELHYQVGATPEGVEVPQAASDPALQALIAEQPPGHRASPLARHDPADPKWRFMWRVGPRPASTSFAELNASPVLPAGFPDWEEVMGGWGSRMLAAVQSAAELAAEGLGLPPTAFADRMACGPHLLAPTGADLEKYSAVGTVIAGFHSDLNFLTIHGKSRFPGLHVWLRNGTRIPVRVQEGCLFIQAGKQLEYLTGGHVRAGMHEVVVSQATAAAVREARQQGRPLWRVSSTVFAHIASDQLLAPLGHFAGEEACRQYPQIPAGLFVEGELKKIALAPHKHD
eukprot:CAMPEP_0206142736 /NCGR_PEP_ID=MMETSP1473-20131121/18057_1 /ASSEMBLY_ACC=CAM_ASM_001109 /TAXON_ID=1461547 /ORGANISM="Stichococcus sp, Strain RCC1054" /LENGTH=383 /DNA_ID=CAMNT_0053537849 /DNA_START=242 /DNA_END=1393 /DNA_ORIENTATION=-